MSSPEPTPTPTEAFTTGGPRYPQVRVRLSGHDAHILIGKVAVALRRHVGDAAADEFNAAAHECDSYEAVLQLVKRTVRAR